MVQLHVPTLMAVIVVVTSTIGAFCLASWYGRRDREIYFWLLISNFATGIGCSLAMLRGQSPDWVAIWLAQSLLMVANGSIWAGVQAFADRPRPLGRILLGALVWTAACSIPPVFQSFGLRVLVSTAVSTTYFALIARDLVGCYLQEQIRSRAIGIAAVFATLHAVACLGRIGFVLDSSGIDWFGLTPQPMLGVFAIEAIANVVALSMALTTMERDRAEMLQRRAASTDVLTGALSRRAFLDCAAAWVEKKGQEAALLLFDLDHFKKINDTYGHSVGDDVLVAFAGLVSRRIEVANLIAGFSLDETSSFQYPRWYEAVMSEAAEGGEPIFGRLGGEEFACLLPHLTLRQGLAIGEDIRAGLQALNMRVGNHQLHLSLSGSVVTTADLGHSIRAMLAAADRALYRAKRKGRNRIEVEHDVDNDPMFMQFAG